jgi:hypothetical protein
VIAAVFSYLDVIRRDGVPKHVVDEVAQMSQVLV